LCSSERGRVRAQIHPGQYLEVKRKMLNELRFTADEVIAA
jgi:hypothetical protein